jgi:hypothetical protein
MIKPLKVRRFFEASQTGRDVSCRFAPFSYNSFMRSVVLTATALAFVASFSTAQPARPPLRVEAAVPFAVGERLAYDVTYSSYLVAGTAVTTVQDKRPASPGGPSYSIVVEGRPIPMLANLYRLYYKMDTLLDSVTLLPHRGSIYTEEGPRKRTASTRFDRATNKALFEVQAETSGRLEFDVPPQVQDGLSALYVLRTMTFKPGDTISLPVADEGVVYTLRASVAGTERVSVPLGEFNASILKVAITDPNGQPAAANAAMWISTDTRRLPLKMQADLAVGSFVLLLRTASP